MVSKFEGEFNNEYKKLNKFQKEAVDAIDGPVMVVAGPGTGKTQTIALRIANILKKTDIKADGILCLTFTNSGVEAMKERLVRYIGEDGQKVNIFTFHSFGMKIIEEHFKVLGLKEAPKLLGDLDRAIFFDQILSENEWEHLRPRSNSLRYFQDLKSLLSLFKRERITVEDFASAIEKEIKSLEGDEENRSTRGASKGKLKKETLKKIDGLLRSREVSKFFKLYEQAKKEKNLLDYDDVLEYLVRMVETSKEVASTIRERYLYILIDEHQDSSRVQNEFIKKVWAKVEKPDIFVVGDDRQLIYGFSGASIEYFTNFQKTFKNAKLITLVDNYRSTQVILDASHALLQSVLSKDKLQSHSSESHPIGLVEAHTGEEELIAAAQDIAGRMRQGINPDKCAILVPKNREVREALLILHKEGIPIGTSEALNLFDQDEVYAFLRVLKIINDGDPVSLALSFFDKNSGLLPLEADTFLSREYMRDFSFDKLLSKSSTLFPSGGNVEKWIKSLSKWKKDFKKNDLKSSIQILGKELFHESEVEKSGKRLVSVEEILNTILKIFDEHIENNPNITLAGFILYLEKIISFGEVVPIVTLPKEGVKVLTLHGSKGLEFDYVWIAHMDENSLNGGKRMGFTLPEEIALSVEERDIDSIKRKLYVAITRAKRFCTISYALSLDKERECELAKIIADLPDEVFKKEKAKVLSKNISLETNFSGPVKLAKDKYKDRYISAWLLNNFFECPWKWYFKNLLQLPEAKTESLEFGGKVHDAIDQILKLKKEILPDDKQVAKVVSLWIKNRLAQIAPNRENEKSLSAKHNKFPHLSIYGKIDLVEYLGSDSARVTDFKTGSIRKKSDVEKKDEEGRMSTYLRQLAIYVYLLQESFKNKYKIIEGRLEFLEAKNPKESLYDTVIGDEQIDLLIQDIADYDSLLKSGDWASRPCHFKSYGKQNAVCEYCKMAEIYNGSQKI
ncbi:hypothetical protein A2238_00505 [Candidatus Nomurabacteria bacterium RIFOXYA2_FULL_35_9]|nr:MAG: hypothetical protein A2238_00505 [Candidatus Nomurabacteria bacterium RIFOXYA2_FULL_35_9]